MSSFAEASGRDLPTTSRGVRTRAKLVDAARAVFERDGFLDARLLDITGEAGVSAGTFYTYFDSKEEVFAAVLADVEEEMLHPGVKQVADDEDPITVIEAANLAYLESYRRNARFMALLEQVAGINEEFRQLRRRRAHAFVQRNARSIENLRQRGWVKTDIDSLLAAELLSGMVSRAGYTHFVTSTNVVTDAAVEELATAVSVLWVNALQISPPV